MKKRSLLIYVFLLIGCVTLRAQSVTVDNFSADDILQREQLKGNSDNRSFIIRPVNLLNHRDDSVSGMVKSSAGTFHFLKVQGRFTALPLDWVQAYNSNRPYGWNDGAMIPAKGAQILFSAGIYATFGKFSVQLQPEIIYAQNLDFETFQLDNSSYYWKIYYRLLNHIDNPEQFGSGTYKKFFPGQSSIYFHPKNLAIGISTENIWWGPGIQNSLVMSNNAPGYLHADIHTTRPVQTAIGSFEFQLLGGQLKNSGIPPPDSNMVYNSSFIYQPKYPGSRYITGITVSWQPKGLNGLFLGFSQASYLYKKDISGIADIFPLQGIIQSDAEKQGKKSTLGSVFMRYVFPESHAELYAELGRNDRSADIINLITDKNYPRAYIVGMKKLANLRANKSYLSFSAEIAVLELPGTLQSDSSKRSWYTSNYVRQGYTNEGQVLGAGIGPGSNSQMLDISWNKGFTSTGVQLQRIVHNKDLYYSLFSFYNDISRYWADLSTAVYLRWKYKNLYLHARMELTRSMNYEYQVLPGALYFTHGYDFLNFHGNLSVVYTFK